MDRVERYIPPELRPTVELLGMFNPVQGIMEDMSAAGRGDYGEAALGTALTASPLAAARYLRQPAKAALAEVFGFSGDDLARGLGQVSGGSRSRALSRDVSAPSSVDDLQPSEGITRRGFLQGLGAVTVGSQLPIDDLARGLGRASRGGLGGRLGALSDPLRRAREIQDSIFPSERLVNSLRAEIYRLENSNPYNLLETMESFEDRQKLISESRAKIAELQESLSPSLAEYNRLMNEYNESRYGILRDVFENPDDYVDELSDLSDDELTTLIDQVALSASRYGEGATPVGDDVYFSGMDRLVPVFERELRSRGMVQGERLDDAVGNVEFLRSFLAGED